MCVCLAAELFSLVGADGAEDTDVWRAQWLGGAIPAYQHLEAVVRSLLRTIPTVETSALMRNDGSILEIKRRRDNAKTAVLFHCTIHDPGTEGSVVPVAEAAGPLTVIRRRRSQRLHCQQPCPLIGLKRRTRGNV